MTESVETSRTKRRQIKNGNKIEKKRGTNIMWLMKRGIPREYGNVFVSSLGTLSEMFLGQGRRRRRRQIASRGNDLWSGRIGVFLGGERSRLQLVHGSLSRREGGGRQTAVNDLNQRSLTAAGVDPTLFFALFVSLPRPLCHLNRMIK